jgi:hypothetical protein
MTSAPQQHQPRKPWYREPWPWILISGPAIAVVASFTSAYFAFHGADALVEDDYYKQGLAINRDIARDEAAQKMGIAGEIRVEQGVARVSLHAKSALPDRMTLLLVHPTLAARDLVVHLARQADATFDAPIPALAPVHWLAIVQTDQWRVSAQLDTRAGSAAALAPGVR